MSGAVGLHTGPEPYHYKRIGPAPFLNTLLNAVTTGKFFFMDSLIHPKEIRLALYSASTPTVHILEIEDILVMVAIHGERTHKLGELKFPTAYTKKFQNGAEAISVVTKLMAIMEIPSQTVPLELFYPRKGNKRK